jgi:hypothetical protein
MSEMVERVAKAIFEAIFDCSGYDAAVNFHLEDWTPAARAAIAAMREPTAAKQLIHIDLATRQMKALEELRWRDMGAMLAIVIFPSATLLIGYVAWRIWWFHP